MQLILMEMTLCFFLIALKQVNAAVVATISIAHLQLCVPDAVRNLNVTVFNLVSGTNETRLIEWHETCKCRLMMINGSVNAKN